LAQPQCGMEGNTYLKIFCMDDWGRRRLNNPMTMIVDRFPYPAATLRGQDKSVISAGAASIDIKRCRATFFPSQIGDVDTILKKTAILEIKDGKTYSVLQIEYSEIPQLGYASPHYEIDIGDTGLHEDL